MPPRLRKQYLAEPDDERLEVWPENWRALLYFQAVITQLTRDPAGQVIGLHYPSLETVFNCNRIPSRQRARLFSDIQDIERGALEALREKAQDG